MTGFKDLPRNGAWLLSKAFTAPSSMSGAVTGGISDEMRRTAIAVADAIPGTGEPVELRLKRAEAAVARAKNAEQAALADAQNASVLATGPVPSMRRDASACAEPSARAKRKSTVARSRPRTAWHRSWSRSGPRQPRTSTLRLNGWHPTSGAQVDRAQAEAEAAAERARAKIDQAHEQLAAARSLATQATEAAERVAEQAHQHARSLAASAEQEAGSADRFVNEARRTEASLKNAAARAVRTEQQQPVPSRLNELTKAELAELAEPLGVTATSHMAKDDLIKAIRRASRAKTRA